MLVYEEPGMWVMKNTNGGSYEMLSSPTWGRFAPQKNVIICTKSPRSLGNGPLDKYMGHIAVRL
jgi:hypothetical protein